MTYHGEVIRLKVGRVWEIDSAPRSSHRLRELLADGWEPFAAYGGGVLVRRWRWEYPDETASSEDEQRPPS